MTVHGPDCVKTHIKKTPGKTEPAKCSTIDLFDSKQALSPKKTEVIRKILCFHTAWSILHLNSMPKAAIDNQLHTMP